MVRKKIREYIAKEMVYQNFKKYAPQPCVYDFNQPFRFLIDDSTDLDQLEQSNPDVLKLRWVVKPDMLFGKRAKRKLVLLDVSFDECKKWINDQMGKTVTISDTIQGQLTHFIIEEFIPHHGEYYISMVSDRYGTIISYSSAGGIDVEAKWDQIKKIHIPIDCEYGNLDLAPLFVDKPHEINITAHFIMTIYRIFCELDFVFVEMNPWSFNAQSYPVILDLRVEIDSSSYFKNQQKLLYHIDLVPDFGHTLTKEEKYIQELDSKSGASLKFTILNPNGCIWMLIAGGGASVVFADTVVSCGYGHELANYGEYSGAPNKEETYEYAKTIINLASSIQLKYPEERKVLIIGGAIANFTDILVTFKGICHAIEKYSRPLIDHHFKIWVRRGGPNCKEGLELMKSVGLKTGLEINVYGPEIGLTQIVPMSINYIRQNRKPKQEIK